MAKYHQIIHEVMKLSIPNGVRQIIAEYAFVSGRERMITLLKNHNGIVLLFNNQEPRGALTLYVYFCGDSSIVLAPAGHRYRRRIPIENLVLILKSQFWNKCRLGSRMKMLAPLWQRLYDMWMATVV